jgi:hypothetical protein
MALDDTVNNELKLLISTDCNRRLGAAYRTLRKDLVGRDFFKIVNNSDGLVKVESNFGHIGINYRKVDKTLEVSASGSYISALPEYLSGRLSKFGDHISISEYEK